MNEAKKTWGFKIEHPEENEQSHITGYDPLSGSIIGNGCIEEVASDTVAVLKCLSSWAERLMREEGSGWTRTYYRIISDAKENAFNAILKGKP